MEKRLSNHLSKRKHEEGFATHFCHATHKKLAN